MNMRIPISFCSSLWWHQNTFYLADQNRVKYLSQINEQFPKNIHERHCQLFWWKFLDNFREILLIILRLNFSFEALSSIQNALSTLRITRALKNKKNFRGWLLRFRFLQSNRCYSSSDFPENVVSLASFTSGKCCGCVQSWIFGEPLCSSRTFRPTSITDFTSLDKISWFQVSQLIKYIS